MTYLFTTDDDAKVFACPEPCCENGTVDAGQGGSYRPAPCERCDGTGQIDFDSGHGVHDALSMGLKMPWDVAVEWAVRDGADLIEAYALCEKYGIERPKVAAE